MLYHTFSTQEEIDQEYNPRFIVKNTDELIQSYFTESQRVLREYSNRSAVAYGPTPSETLDIFPAEKLCSPIHIFFHGGYWHSLTSRDFAFVAEGLVRNGITAVLVNYALCPSVNIDEIVRQYEPRQPGLIEMQRTLAEIRSGSRFPDILPVVI